jgi:hypothetical protein
MYLNASPAARREMRWEFQSHTEDNLSSARKCMGVVGEYVRPRNNSWNIKRVLRLSVLLRLAGITVEVFLPVSTRDRHRKKHTEHTQISMPLMGFEPTISVLERAKTVRALDCAATAIGNSVHEYLIKLMKALG